MTAAVDSVELDMRQSYASKRRKVKDHLAQAVKENAGPIWDSVKEYAPYAGGVAATLAPLLVGFGPGIVAGKVIWNWRGNAYLETYGKQRRVGGLLFTAPYRALRGLQRGTKGSGTPWSDKLGFRVLNGQVLKPVFHAASGAWGHAYDKALEQTGKDIDGSLEARDAVNEARQRADDATLWIEPYFQKIGEALRRGEPIYKVPTDRNVLNEMRTGLYAPRLRKRWSEGPAKMYPRGVNTSRPDGYYRMTLMYPPGTFEKQGRSLLASVPKTFQGKPVRDVIGVKAYPSLTGAHIYRARGGNWKKIGVVDWETKEQREKRQREDRARRQAETRYGRRTPSNGDALGAEIAGANNTTKALMAVVAAKLVGLF